MHTSSVLVCLPSPNSALMYFLPILRRNLSHLFRGKFFPALPALPTASSAALLF